MATTTVDATYQGVIGYFDFGYLDWVSDIRNSVIGNDVSTYTTNTTNNNAISANNDFGRAGFTGNCYRTFLFFGNINTAIGGGTITSATLKVWNGGSGTSTQTIVISSSAWGGNGSDGNLNSGDYLNIDYGTLYSSNNTSWNGNAYNDFSLDATAISNMGSDGYLNCAIIEYDYDYNEQNPPSGTNATAPVEFLDPTNKIKLDITYTPAGYTKTVIGVTGASIGRVNGVLSANISKVIGVS